MCPNCEKKVSKKTIALGAFFLLILVASNTYASKSAHKHHGKKMNMHQKKGDRIVLKGSEKKEVLEVFQVNEELHKTFFEDRIDKSSQVVSKLIGSIKKVSHSKIKQNLDKALDLHLSKLKDGKENIKSNKEHYHKFSTKLVQIIKAYDIGAKYNAYFCSMAEKTWIQNTEKIAGIQNPYAPDMKGCGNQVSQF